MNRAALKHSIGDNREQEGQDGGLTLTGVPGSPDITLFRRAGEGPLSFLILDLYFISACEIYCKKKIIIKKIAFVCTTTHGGNRIDVGLVING